MSQKNNTQKLLAWAQQCVRDYPNAKISSFKKESWRDGLAFLSILHYYDPAVLPSIQQITAATSLGNLKLAFELGTKHFDIEAYLEPEDLSVADDKSIFTHVQEMYIKLHKKTPLGKQQASLEAFADSLVEDPKQTTREKPTATTPVSPAASTTPKIATTTTTSQPVPHVTKVTLVKKPSVPIVTTKDVPVATSTAAATTPVENTTTTKPNEVVVVQKPATPTPAPVVAPTITQPEKPKEEVVVLTPIAPVRQPETPTVVAERTTPERSATLETPVAPTPKTITIEQATPTATTTKGNDQVSPSVPAKPEETKPTATAETKPVLLDSPRIANPEVSSVSQEPTNIHREADSNNLDQSLGSATSTLISANKGMKQASLQAESSSNVTLWIVSSVIAIGAIGLLYFKFM